jgi:hypothetical protein
LRFEAVQEKLMLPNSKTEKRETTRLSIETTVRLSDDDSIVSYGKILNLSATGALIETSEQLTIGNHYNLTIKIKGNNSNLLIDNLLAIVVRNKSNTIAVQFTDTMEWLTLFYVYRRKLKLDKI